MTSAYSMMLVAYLLGSIPFAFIAVKLAGKGDVRRQGSGNVGATNTLRTAGWRVALPVMVGDVGKGVLAVLLARWFLADPEWIAGAGLFAIIGHCFPVWLAFSGGKGVATAAGVFFTLAWPAALVCAGVWFGVLVTMRMVSMASVAAATAFPIAFALIMHPTWPALTAAIVAAAIIISRHHSNLRRMLRGQESRVGEMKP